MPIGNHLGNVLTTVSDRKIGVYSNGSLTLPNDSVVAVVDYYEPHMVNATDYYAFGMPSRVAGSATGKEYRHGFNGKENDNEVKGFGNQQDYGMRIYDARLGRFLSVDPLMKGYPMLTPYAFAENSPIENIDLDGLEKKSSTTVNAEAAVATVTTARGLSNTVSVNGEGRLIERKVTEEIVKKSNPGLWRYAKGGGLFVTFMLSPLNAGVGKPDGPAPEGKHWGGDYWTNKNPLEKPLVLYLPEDLHKPKEVPKPKYEPTKAPPKDDEERSQYYLYETIRNHKQAAGLVPAGTSLPYFGITSQPFSPGRYSLESIEGKGLDHIIGVTNRYLAKGAETALMLINSPGWSVINSTRIDNEVISTGDILRIKAGEYWLFTIDKNWKVNYKRPENPKNTTSQSTGSDN